MVIGHGVEVPNSVGLHGGMPGACATHMLRRSNHDVSSLLGRYYDAASIMADSQTQDLGAKPGGFRIGPGDVFAYTFQGGGGYGDPLQRDPLKVARDVADGYVTARWAADLYGVVLGADGAPDRGRDHGEAAGDPQAAPGRDGAQIAGARSPKMRCRWISRSRPTGISTAPAVPISGRSRRIGRTRPRAGR